MTSWYGSKGTTGLCQPLIAMCPPHDDGHNGAGGQLAWGDPATGLSLGYTTNGYDEHEVRQPRRDTAISSLAGLCTTPD